MWNQIKANTEGEHGNQKHNTEVNDVLEYLVNDINQWRDIIIQAKKRECPLNHDEHYQNFNISLRFNVKTVILLVCILGYMGNTYYHKDDINEKENDTGQHCQVLRNFEILLFVTYVLQVG